MYRRFDNEKPLKPKKWDVILWTCEEILDSMKYFEFKAQSEEVQRYIVEILIENKKEDWSFNDMNYSIEDYDDDDDQEY